MLQGQEKKLLTEVDKDGKRLLSCSKVLENVYVLWLRWAFLMLI
jgi:hypothetical protein